MGRRGRKGRPVASSAPIPGGTRKPNIVLFNLHEEELFPYIQPLANAVREKADVKHVTTVGAAERALATSPPPDAVLAIDSSLAAPEHRQAVMHVVRYLKSGGTVIIGGTLSSFTSRENAHAMFQMLGVPWKFGDYHRTDSTLNASIRGLNVSGLVKSYSNKAVYLNNVASAAVVYKPAKGASLLPSHVSAPAPVNVDEVSVAYTQVGAGFLGYAGDVNMQDDTARIILRMLRLPSDHFQPSPPPAPIPGSALFGNRAGKTPLPSTGLAIVNPTTSTSRQSDTKKPTSAPQVGKQRPREAEVQARAAKRAIKMEQRSAAGQKWKQQGNACFKAQDYIGAVQCYRKACDEDFPRAIYFNNLAASLLKLERFKEAERAADEALRRSSKLLKAKFRRGQARKGSFRLKGAIRDFEKCLEQDPTCTEARTELAAAKNMYNLGYSMQHGVAPEESSDESYDEDFEIYPSDSSDYVLEGEGVNIPCRRYNTTGCGNSNHQSPKCTHRHGPDDLSVRDDLGRNVCIHFLLGTCKKGSNTCPYAHDKQYLPTKGWWRKPEKIRLLRALCDISKSAKLPQAPMEAWLGKCVNGLYAQTVDWSWLEGTSGKGRELNRTSHTTSGSHQDVIKGILRSNASSPPMSVSSYDLEYDPEAKKYYDYDDEADEEFERAEAYEDELEERAMNFGFTNAEAQELLCQGVKPWDDDAWNVHQFLQSGYE